jgi:hypothetical protein
MENRANEPNLGQPAPGKKVKGGWMQAGSEKAGRNATNKAKSGELAGVRSGEALRGNVLHNPYFPIREPENRFRETGRTQ